MSQPIHQACSCPIWAVPSSQRVLQIYSPREQHATEAVWKCLLPPISSLHAESVARCVSWQYCPRITRWSRNFLPPHKQFLATRLGLSLTVCLRWPCVVIVLLPLYHLLMVLYNGFISYCTTGCAWPPALTLGPLFYHCILCITTASHDSAITNTKQMSSQVWYCSYICDDNYKVQWWCN